jgi:hypothetical protein
MIVKRSGGPALRQHLDALVDDATALAGDGQQLLFGGGRRVQVDRGRNGVNRRAQAAAATGRDICALAATAALDVRVTTRPDALIVDLAVPGMS